MARYYQTQDGQILPMTALLLIPLMIFAAFALDMGSFFLRASELQTASDLAALAGAEAVADGQNNGDVEDLVEEILAANGIDIDDVRITVQINGDEVTVTVLDEEVKQFFSTLIVDQVDVSRSATAAIGACPGCSQDLTIRPFQTSLPSAGDGDGYKVTPVEVGSDVRLYALNHHEGRFDNRRQLVCVSVELSARCPSAVGGEFPIPLDTSTSWESHLAHTEATDQLWYNATKPAADNSHTVWGFGCVELNGLPCPVGVNGFVRHGRAETVELWDSANGSGDAIGAFASEPWAFGSKVFSIDYELRVHCFDAATGTDCWGGPQLHPAFAPAAANFIAEEVVGPNREWSRSGNVIDSIVVQNNLYVSYTKEGNVGSRVVCYDMANERPCSGWQLWDVDLGASANGGTGIGALFADFDGNQEVGVCAAVLHFRQLNCRDESGAIYDKTQVANAVRDLRNDSSIVGFEPNPFRAGPRLFVAHAGDNGANGGSIHCVDTVAEVACPTDTLNYAPLTHVPYTFSEMPQGNCFVSLGHDATFEFFDSDLNPCGPGSVRERVYPCECSAGNFRWGSIDFTSFGNTFEEMWVTIYAPDGTELVARTNVLETNNRLELGEVADGLTYVELEVEVTVRVGLTWDSPITEGIEVTERAALID